MKICIINVLIITLVFRIKDATLHWFLLIFNANNLITSVYTYCSEKHPPSVKKRKPKTVTL